MKKKLTVFLVLSCLILISCSKKDNQPAKNDTKVITKFVFNKADNPLLTEDVEGVISGNEIKVVLYGMAKNNLKPTITYQATAINPANSSPQDFTNPVTYTLTAENGTTTTYKVTVESRDVYIAGFDYDQAKQKYRAVYWKNGNKVTLSDGTSNAQGKGMLVVGNDIYVSGSITQSNGKSGAVYWKNGNMVALNIDPLVSAYAYLMAVSGNDVYVVGSVDGKATYWKNGVKTEISNVSSDTFLTGTMIVGNDIYLYGQRVPSSLIGVATYWKNGQPISLSDGTTEGDVTQLSMAGTDLYASGLDKGNAVYWKNGNKTELGKGYAWSISISGTDVYVSGVDNSTGKNVATYWKNGNKITLSDGQGDAVALSIVAIGTDVYVAGNDKTVNSVGIATCWVNGKSMVLSTNGFARTIFVK